MRDSYRNVSSLMAVEYPHVNIQWRVSNRSDVAIVAPHAGRIEPVTGELAIAIAGREHRLYCFSGRDQANNRRLHVTSTRFTEPYLTAVLLDAFTVVSVHGCRLPDRPITQVGGANANLRERLLKSLTDSGFEVRRALAPLSGKHPRNVTNRAPAGGAQLEISWAQRKELHRERSRCTGKHDVRCSCAFCRYVNAIRTGIDHYHRQKIGPTQ